MTVETENINSPGEIAILFVKWNEALQTGDARAVAALYAPEAILLPTTSDEIRKSSSAIEAYFDSVLSARPVLKMVEQNIRRYGRLAINSGLYELEAEGPEGRRKSMARFTFVYEWVRGDWLIVEHHSSLLPEQSGA